MRILLIEDEVKLARAIKRGLELQNHAVDMLHDGQDGLDFALTEKVDLIILDVMLPGLDGIRICEQLRSNRNNTPIIMLTAKGQIADRTTGLDAGADDYLVKPFSFEELFSRMRAVLRRTRSSGSPILSVADLTLNPATAKVVRNGVAIELSSKEYAILEFLLRNAGIRLSKEKIVQHVWDYDANVLPSTVEVHIKHLRDKIDRPFSKQLIVTVRGFGYELQGDT